MCRSLMMMMMMMMMMTEMVLETSVQYRHLTRLIVRARFHRIILPAVLHVCEKWPCFTLRGLHKLKVFQNVVL
jgi:hypothetical protein